MTSNNARKLNLKEARTQDRLDEFARQHEIPPEDQYPQARERFEKLLDLAFRRGSRLKAQRPELALVELAKAAPPPRAHGIIPTNGRYEPWPEPSPECDGEKP